jgi:amidase
VATGDADVAYGSDTGGSVRIPSACCGTAGLKTTHGRISLDGVWPLAPSFDTIGPMARDVAGLVLGMQLLEPGFEVATTAPRTVGRLRNIAGIDPVLEAAVDAALALAEFDVVDVELPWLVANLNCGAVVVAEAWAADQHLVNTDPEHIGADVLELLRIGEGVPADALQRGLAESRAWRGEVDAMLGRVELLALPTMVRFPGEIGATGNELATLTQPVNASGHPAIALPIPAAGSRLPASIQLVGPHGSEDQLLAAGRVLEAAVAG